MTSVQNKSRQW